MIRFLIRNDRTVAVETLLNRIGLLVSRPQSRQCGRASLPS
jgi:hypothetical protein